MASEPIVNGATNLGSVQRRLPTINSLAGTPPSTSTKIGPTSLQPQKLFLSLAIASLSTLALSHASAAGIDPTPLTNNSVKASVTDQDTWSVKRAILDDLRDGYGLDALNAGDVLSDTNRGTVEDWGNVELYCDSRKKDGRTELYDATYNFAWNYDDRESTGWYPQGISGTGDAYDSGLIDGKRGLVVSWYAKDDSQHEGKGARISFVDISDLNHVTYRHALLVEPYVNASGAPNFRAVNTHAGGIAWYGRYLYVADTSWGYRVFDMNRIFRTQSTSDKSKIGMLDGNAYAHDYVYAIPMVSRYKQPPPPSIMDVFTGLLSFEEYAELTNEQFRYSFLSVDRTTSTHNLVVGEYEDGSSDGRFTRWSLDESTGKIGNSSSFGTKNIRRENTQGVVRAHGTWFYNHSYSSDQYRIHMQLNDGTVRSIRGGYGLEDMYYDSQTKRLWMLTEHPGSRKVFYKYDPINAWANGDPDGYRECN